MIELLLLGILLAILAPRLLIFLGVVFLLFTFAGLLTTAFATFMATLGGG